MIYTLYALVDSRQQTEVRYVGYTKDPEWRLVGHVRAAVSTVRGRANHKTFWIRKVLLAGGDVVLRRLCVVDGAQAAKDLEVLAIASYRKAGHDLTNSTLGGDGVQGYTMSKEVMARLREYRNSKDYLEKRSQQSKAYWTDGLARDKQRKAMKSFWSSPEGAVRKTEVAEKTRVAQTGRKYSAESREKMRQAKIGKPQMKRTPEWAAKISAAQKGKARRPWTPEERARHEAGMNKEKMSPSAKARRSRESAQRVTDLIQTHERLTIV